MPDPTLPPSVYQGLGWGPVANPGNAPLLPPPDAPPEWGGLPSSIPQGMGWSPPPDTPPMPPQLPPTPTELPSSGAGPGAATPSGPNGPPDYRIPVSAFVSKPASGSPTAKPGAAPAAAPAKPQTFGQGMADLRQREQQTEQAQIGAIGAGVEAQQQLHADQLGAYQQAQKTTEANAAERKAEDESWKKTYATNAAKTAADQQAVDSWKFNRNKYMDELGVGRKVSWGIGMILAGIGQGMQRQSGPNPVLAMLQQNIHDANAEQMTQRDALVQKLGFDRETGKDAAQYHATRQAEIDKRDGLAYTALGKQLEEAAVKSADPVARANGLKEAANVRAMGDERLKSYIQLQSEHDHQQQQIGIAGGHLALERKKFDWEKDKDQQQLDINAAKLLASKQGKLDEEQAKRALYIPDPSGNGQLIVARKQDGSPVLAGSADIAAKDQNMIAAAASYNRLVGQMVRGIQEHGGESTWIKGSDWQKMVSDLQSATAELHDAYGITAFREPTVKFFEKMASAGVDPTSFVRDASGALQHSNENLQAKVNERVQARGYDGPQFGWRDTSHPAKPEPTADDIVAGRALVNPAEIYNQEPDRVMRELGVSATGLRGTEISSKVAARLREEGGMLPSVRQAMGTYASAMASPDPKVASHYRALLEKISEESESPAAASYAKQLLDRAQQNQINATPGAANAPEQIRGSSGAPRSP